ncbi:MAG: hypothetical protein VCB25_09745 [Myxococcota bacterium]
MNRQSETQNGLEAILHLLGERYEFDEVGRLVRMLSDGILPRFVLGRAAEGCIWRFAASLESDCVTSVARLAGREPGFPHDSEVRPPPPERLVMIERLLSFGPPAPSADYEALTQNGVLLAELWTFP